MSAVMQTTQPMKHAPWCAEIELGFEKRGIRSVLAHRKQRGPLVVQRPFYPEGETAHLYLLHPPGGVVGGDQLSVQVDAAANSQALITTPGATKFYLSAGDTAIQQQTLRVEDNATLEWLPQETIYFPGAICRLDTRIELAPSAGFIGWEIHCLGSPVANEVFDHGRVNAGLSLSIDGRLVLSDRLRVSEQDLLSNAANLRGLPVSATLIAQGVSAELRDRLRDDFGSIEAGHLGMTLLEQTLVVRYLGHSTESIRNRFIQIWSSLRPALLNRAPCPPRIWAT